MRLLWIGQYEFLRYGKACLIRFLEGVFEPFFCNPDSGSCIRQVYQTRSDVENPYYLHFNNNRAISLAQILYCTSSRVSEKISH